jgi:hypothetical protein
MGVNAPRCSCKDVLHQALLQGLWGAQPRAFSTQRCTMCSQQRQ